MAAKNQTTNLGGKLQGYFSFLNNGDSYSAIEQNYGLNSYLSKLNSVLGDYFQRQDYADFSRYRARAIPLSNSESNYRSKNSLYQKDLEMISMSRRERLEYWRKKNCRNCGRLLTSESDLCSLCISYKQRD